MSENSGEKLIEIGEKMQNVGNKTSKIGCLTTIIVLAVLVIALVVIFKPSNSSSHTNSNTTASVSEQESSVPDEVELITYAETILNREFGNADFSWSSYYNVVPPNSIFRTKVEGSVKINGVSHTFTVIYDFTDDTYKTYDAKYLSIDKEVLYDLR